MMQHFTKHYAVEYLGMTYAEFILIFLIVPAARAHRLAYWLQRRGRMRRVETKYHWLGVGILALIAFVWTTPWDNYLIADRRLGFSCGSHPLPSGLRAD